MTLASDLPIPTIDFMRLRLVEQKRLSTVLRDNNLTLRYVLDSKINSLQC
jgi:hypothetical protein